MKRLLQRSAICIGLALASFSAQAQQTEKVDAKPTEILVNMVEALDQRSYSGTLTYEFGGPLETLEFSRVVAADGTQERIRHLSGKPRDFVRKLPSDYCGNAAKRLFMAEGKAPLAGLSQYYRFTFLGQNRVADRVVDIVQIKSIIGDRHGYTLGIDAETALPLMLTLTGERGQILERFQFVELTPAPVVDLKPTADVVHQLDLADTHCEPSLLPSGWRPQWLPRGFVLASATVDGDKTQLSFTDGLASLSVFVTPVEAVSGAVGVVQRGATVAAMNLVARGQSSYKVAVVGEVPAAVARKIATSVAFVP